MLTLEISIGQRVLQSCFVRRECPVKSPIQEFHKVSSGKYVVSSNQSAVLMVVGDLNVLASSA